MKKQLYVSFGLLAAFTLWTVAVCRVDVQPIGPEGSFVGFASLNGFFHNLTGVHMSLYVITDWLGLVPLGVAAGFACLGLLQWIRRKHLRDVDRNILVLGGFYVTVMVAFLFFEAVVINYRPVLIEGVLEASYPSSTTMLVLCIVPTAIMQLRTRVQNRTHRRWITVIMTVFALGMVLARLASGVHWLTDIIGGVLLSGSLVMLYAALAGRST